MSTKLYDKELHVKEISVAEFDAIEGTHTFSEKYENKKFVVLETFRQKTPKSMNKTMKVAVAALAVIICSGTALATNGTYLREFYESRINGIDEKYVEQSFLEATYDLPVEVETDDESGLLDFRVLQVAKGEHTISTAVVVTVNHPESYDEARFYDVGLGLEIVGMKDANLKTGIGYNINWDSSELYGREEAQRLGLKKNQILIINEYRYDDEVDLSQVKDIELLCNHVLYVKQNPNGKDEYIYELINEEYKWKLPVVVEQEYNDKVVELNQSFTIGDRKFQIEKMRVTPLGIGFVYEAQDDFTWEMKEKISTDCSINDYYKEFKLVMSDGNKIKVSQVCEERAGYQEDDAGEHLYDRFLFKIPINVQQIVGVEIAGELVEIK